MNTPKVVPHRLFAPPMITAPKMFSEVVSVSKVDVAVVIVRTYIM